MGKQSQLLLKPTEVELGLQVGVEFDNNNNYMNNKNNNTIDNHNHNNIFLGCGSIEINLVFYKFYPKYY